MPLAMVQEGRRVRVIGIHGGRKLQGRLAAMGLVPGVEIEVIRNGFHGPFIVGIKGSRVMMGRGMAFKIQVQ